MFKIIPILSALFLTLSLAAQTKKALFIGNSYTASNNLPGLVEQLALSNGDTLIHDMNTPGGYTFQAHSTNATTLAKINANDWDFVVLQEQSQLPSFSPGQVANDVYPYAALLDSAIDANGNCPETMFFMTWGRKYGDASNCAAYPPVCTYEGMQQRLRASYLEMMNEHYGIMSPVGSAFWQSRMQDSTINLYTSDNSHPSLHGSYLAACVFYACLWQESPVGLSFTSSLPAADALFLQEIADQVVFDSTDLWFYGYEHPKLDTIETICSFLAVQYSAPSTDANYWFWDFGDGYTSTDESPPYHVYSSGGWYPVTLTISDGCDTLTYQQQVTIPCNVSVPEIQFSFEIIPNPAKEQVYIELLNTSSSMNYQLVNIAGQTIKSGTIYRSKYLDVSALSDGVYFLRIGSQIERLVIQN